RDPPDVSAPDRQGDGDELPTGGLHDRDRRPGERADRRRRRRGGARRHREGPDREHDRGGSHGRPIVYARLQPSDGVTSSRTVACGFALPPAVAIASSQTAWGAETT